MHPVLRLLEQRKSAGSQPGRRGDGGKLALVVEGGGMRGVVSSAMTAALERAGLTGCFDLVVGCSAGALNAAALLANVAEACMDEYSGAFAGRRFINPFKLLLGRPAVDVAYALDHANEHLDAARHTRVVTSPVPLHCVATDVQTTEATDLTDLRTLGDLRAALLATTRLPWMGGPPVAFRGRRYLDGGLAEAIPLATALRLGATHALVLLTRPEGVRYPATAGLLERILQRKLSAVNPDLLEKHRQKSALYDAEIDLVARRERGVHVPHVLAVRPPRSAPVVSRFEKKIGVLRDAADASFRAAMETVVRPITN